MAIKIIKNSIECKKCGDVIVSAHVHDFRWCKCGKVGIDGGTYYLKRMGDPKNVIDHSITVEEP